MNAEKKRLAQCHEQSCGRRMYVYSRVVGYIRPVQNWNDAKQEEFAERETYRVSDASDQGI